LRRGRGVVQTIRLTKNPAAFAVLVLALAGLWLSARLDAPWIDGAFSVLIGLLLCAVALVMVYESKGLIVGEGVEPATAGRVREIVLADPAVADVRRVLTLYLGPEEVLLAVELRFHGGESGREIRAAVARLKKRLRERFPRFRHIFFGSAGA
jgi:divalent metal cation (Fe/Co/Zn/Cd) transporter